LSKQQYPTGEKLMNVIALIGTLQAEPELRHTQDGLARFSTILAFASERPDEADYQIRVIAFGNLAEEAHATFHHGDKVAVEGRLQAETKTKPEDGTKYKVTEVIARKIYSVGGVVPATVAPVAPVTVATPTKKTAPPPKATATPTTSAPPSAKAAATRKPAAPVSQPVAQSASSTEDFDIPF
jgi:single-strand DNA-binding protein